MRNKKLESDGVAMYLFSHSLFIISDFSFKNNL
jgi:hypothetical protein